MIQDEYTIKALKRNIDMLRKNCRCKQNDRCDCCQSRIANERTLREHDLAVKEQLTEPQRLEPGSVAL